MLRGKIYFLSFFFFPKFTCRELLDRPFVLLFWDNMKNKGGCLQYEIIPLTNVQLTGLSPFKVHNSDFYSRPLSINPDHLISSLIPFSIGWNRMAEVGGNQGFGVRPRLEIFFHPIPVSWP